MGTPSPPTLSHPTTPAKKHLHFADAFTSTLSPSNGGYPCASPSPTTYMSGGVGNPHMQGIVCVSPCSDHSDGVSRAPSTIAYSDSD